MWVWSGFWRLSASRPIIAMVGPARLPPSEIYAFCQLQGWDFTKQRDFLFYVDALDAKFMEVVNEEQEKEQKKREAASKKPNGRR